MIGNQKRFTSLILAALCAALMLVGCTGKPGVTPAPSQASSTAKASGAAVEATSAPASSAPMEGQAGQPGGFAAAFQTVDKNPLNEAIQFSLWYAAQHPVEQSPAPTGGSSNLLQQYAGTYAALVAEKGIHYIEASSVMGMQIKTEVWVKGQKFKKRTPDLAQVTLFDGQNYIQYDEASKTGTRSPAASASSEGTILTKGMIASMAAAPYEKRADKKIGSFDCSVFYFDISVMGYKGETLYVDKTTGMLVKMQLGDPKDKKNSMATTIETLTVGGFGDEVFSVPDDVKLEG